MRRLLLAFLLLSVSVVPLSASQFIQLPFDKVVQGSTIIVRGTIGPVNASWDADHEIIFSSANLNISKYLIGHGPQVLRVREVGGTVSDYTQEAIGFPELREGEEVILMLTRWDDSDEYRIHAYRQGKYVVRGARVQQDPQGQGDDRMSSAKAADTDSMTIDEFESMVSAADRGSRSPRNQQ